ncbi:hypothetical protein V8E55_008816 [Tylopilus felleus]
MQWRHQSSHQHDVFISYNVFHCIGFACYAVTCLTCTMSDGRHGLGRLVAGHIQEEGKGEKSTPFSTPSLWKSTPLLSTYRNTTDLSTQALSPSMTGAKGDGSQQTRLLGVSLAPAIVATSVGVAAVFPNNHKVALLCVGACVVTIAPQFLVLPTDDEPTSGVATILKKLPNIFTALGCGLILISVAFAFADAVAIIPLFGFIFFAALPPVTSAIVGPPIEPYMYWLMAVFYVLSVLSLVAFVVLALAI